MAGRGSSIHDVAKAAGVSISTVSKAFNGRADLSEATRVRVLEVAAGMHFVPNALIRSLRRGKTGTIGIYVGWGVHLDTSREITGRLEHGFNRGLIEVGYDALHYVNTPTRTADSIAATFLDGRVDGVVVSPMDVSTIGLEALVNFGLPVVMIYRPVVPDGVGYVTVDNRSGIVQAVDYLLGLGHRHIAFYSPYVTFDNQERAAAYTEALVQNGINVDPALCVDGAGPAVSVAVAYERFQAAENPPTAIIGASDVEALRWWEYLAQRGVSVPDEVSVVGFDDVDAAAMRGLTTIRQPADEVGRLAVLYATALIREESWESCRNVLPVEFVPRASAAPPPK